ncbi:5-formyltetrahydrofolate cyclo-ligase [Kineococcus rhizosphaerae]|uniref:5-formyltetrahydrofolate cyclo-ligase n=1 Tax=Kineococcus rhizosphaerae TaxID=559628 RepID=A0A2T0R102_9ACTN|nr:5-formyltetrahydrofolate cyclo-ligase [Kineococcus rhizosphaerae]PRY12967.1 5-formyltetrahydrofolate cyclo-ligase [Kineococcus rhizosphaerae]
MPAEDTVPHPADVATDTLSVHADVLEVEARKRALRRGVRARRRARDEETAAAVDAGVARVLVSCPLLAGARRVAVYSSLPGEPGTRALLAELRRHDVEVLLPARLPDDDLDWDLRPARADAPGHLGVHAIATADLVVVPALAVDTAGRRLGQGGGSYDRALRRVPARVPVVAVVHDEELLDAAVAPLPTLPHDRLVQAVVTPTRWLWLAA